MFVNTFKRRLVFVCLFMFIIFFLYFYFFYSIFLSDSIIIFFAIHPFNICEEFPNEWFVFKKLFIITAFFSNLIISNVLYSNIFNKSSQTNHNNCSPSNLSDLSLYLGNNTLNEPIYISSSGLYQNILVTGTIGTGKTSSALYPFTQQLISYKCNSLAEKIGILILDVKGNYFKQVRKYCYNYNRINDLIIIDLNNSTFYNPLDKPYLKASVLANRLKTILCLFSKNNSESYWLDKAEQVLAECIKLCRLYNNNYVTFVEIHNLITIPNYYSEKIKHLRELFISGAFSEKDCFSLLSSLNFFEKEFSQLDPRTLSILKSEITLITNCFVSDFEIKNIFCPSKEKINFHGFSDLIKKGKIVVLNMNISEYKNLSKIIAAYLKLDFQSEILSQLSHGSAKRTTAFISDEYQEYVTETDADFFSQSREAKCINIVSTQSYTSLLNTLNNKYSVQTIIQNLVNKLWFRTDDIFTIEEAQKQIGKTDKLKYSKTISENSKETNYSFIAKSFTSVDSNISESINSYYNFDYIYDTNFFTQNLETFSCLGFISNGSYICPPQKISLIPYFKKNLNSNGGYNEK